MSASEDLYSIPGITDAEEEQLRARGYTTPARLWSELLGDEDTGDEAGALKELAARTGLPAGRLAALLAAHVTRHTPALDGAFVRRHWMDLAVTASAIVLIWAMFLWHEPPNAGQRPVLAVMRVPLKTIPADIKRKTPYRATLVASAKSESDTTLKDVEVIAVEAGASPAATIMVESSDLGRIGRLLGAGDLYLVQQTR